MKLAHTGVTLQIAEIHNKANHKASLYEYE